MPNRGEDTLFTVRGDISIQNMLKFVIMSRCVNVWCRYKVMEKVDLLIEYQLIL